VNVRDSRLWRRLRAEADRRPLTLAPLASERCAGDARAMHLPATPPTSPPSALTLRGLDASDLARLDAWRADAALRARAEGLPGRPPSRAAAVVALMRRALDASPSAAPVRP